MSDSPDDLLTVIAKVVAHHEKMINSLAVGHGDTARLLHSTWTRCEVIECGKACTVVNQKNGTVMCDHHAAIAVVNQSSQEDDWSDIPLADSIRRLDDYVNMLKSVLPTVPVFH